MDELESDVNVRILAEVEVKRERTSVIATRGGVWELWVRGLDFRLGRRLENSIVFAGYDF